MFEPVTTTRSTSAVDGAAVPDSAGTAGAGNCANALDARMNGNPTHASKAKPTNLNVFSAFCVIRRRDWQKSRQPVKQEMSGEV
jgi:hypothetical protein